MRGKKGRMVRGAKFRPRGRRAGPLEHVGRYNCHRERIGATRRYFEQKHLQKLKKVGNSDVSAKPWVEERVTRLEDNDLHFATTAQGD